MTVLMVLRDLFYVVQEHETKHQKLHTKIIVLLNTSFALQQRYLYKVTAVHALGDFFLR